MEILDGAFVVEILCHRTSNTFQDYGNSPVLPYVFGHLQSVGQLDIVWDLYLADSLKAGTRSKRGHGQRRKVFTFGTITFHMEDKSRALPAFHAATDCDTVSFFGWKGKLKA